MFDFFDGPVGLQKDFHLSRFDMKLLSNISFFPDHQQIKI
jgi:hypothetical protein